MVNEEVPVFLDAPFGVRLVANFWATFVGAGGGAGGGTGSGTLGDDMHIILFFG